MDYSSSIHEADHPAGASPWGSSPETSPQHNRTTFTSDAPVPCYNVGSPIGSNGLGHDHEHDDGGFGSGFSDYRRPDTASTASASDSQVEDGSKDGPLSPPGEQGPAQPTSPALQQQQQDGSKPTGEDAPGQEQQARRPLQPQFKLQAKITGLERTGRKDPILRFDVHV
jgi:hypothetical protein